MCTEADEYAVFRREDNVAFTLDDVTAAGDGVDRDTRDLFSSVYAVRDRTGRRRSLPLLHFPFCPPALSLKLSFHVFVLAPASLFLKNHGTRRRVFNACFVATTLASGSFRNERDLSLGIPKDLWSGRTRSTPKPIGRARSRYETLSFDRERISRHSNYTRVIIFCNTTIKSRYILYIYIVNVVMIFYVYKRKAKKV